MPQSHETLCAHGDGIAVDHDDPFDSCWPSNLAADKDGGLTSVDFQVFGEVQGVCFRANALAMARLFSLVGHVQNVTLRRRKRRVKAVEGVAQGDPKQVAQFCDWLKMTGSPASRVHHVELSNIKTISSLEFNDFAVKKR